jgi:histidine ammonia-lyase
MKHIHEVSSDVLSLAQIDRILQQNAILSISEESLSRVVACREFLDGIVEQSDALHYGINTGFGSLCDVAISKEQIADLQLNLIMSHACGVGDLVPEAVIRIMLLLKVQSLSYGHSGISPEVLDLLLAFYNRKIYPVIYQLGSLGASGDLAPLAHLSLPLVGLGEVWYKGEKVSTAKALAAEGLQPIRLKAKEGLALLNGTQFSLAYAVWGVLESNRLFNLANLTTALSLDAFQCQVIPFDDRLQKVRPHIGQIKVADSIRHWLHDSEIANNEIVSVQDPYAFRCVPQVHGATYQALAHIESVVTTEINSVTDNPIIFHEDQAILSGGNFHAQLLALPLDYLAIAMAEIGSISERRLYQLIGGKRGLPPFLIEDAGLHSGLMIAQYTAASIVSQNKQYCTPASVDSIVSCNGQEDHVSMAANAATKAYKVIKNVEILLAIEFMAAAQALEFRRPQKTASSIEAIVEQYRAEVTVLTHDRIISTDIEKTVQYLRQL